MQWQNLCDASNPITFSEILSWLSRCSVPGSVQATAKSVWCHRCPKTSNVERLFWSHAMIIKPLHPVCRFGSPRSLSRGIGCRLDQITMKMLHRSAFSRLRRIYLVGCRSQTLLTSKTCLQSVARKAWKPSIARKWWTSTWIAVSPWCTRVLLTCSTVRFSSGCGGFG